MNQKKKAAIIDDALYALLWLKVTGHSTSVSMRKLLARHTLDQVSAVKIANLIRSVR